MFQQRDTTFLLVLNRGAANPLFDWLMPRVTNLHKAWWFLAPVIVLILVAFWRGDRTLRLWIVCAALAVGISDLAATKLVKQMVARDRPCLQVVSGGPMAVPETRLLSGHAPPLDYVATPKRDCPGSSSFPSNHASNMAALAGVCWWFSIKRRARKARGETERPIDWLPLLWFLIPLVIGYSRIYLGYHYPSDVAGGWLLGGFIAAGMILIVNRAEIRESFPDGA